MSTNNCVVLIVKYLNGHSETFELPHLAGDPLSSGQIGKLMEKRMEQNYLALELGDHVKVIPMHTVQCMEIRPVPSKLPDTVIRNARKLEKDISEENNTLDIL
ncbi:MAG: hypothetical protein HOD90_07550 [Nitrospina sp.]|jgi:hypothetical protein|nr:hypothetical protein [Nitrospina sp.]